MRRKVVIWEEHGLYGVESPAGSATGRTVEGALLGAHPDTPEVRSTHDMGEFIETLFGAKSPESGLVSG